MKETLIEYDLSIKSTIKIGSMMLNRLAMKLVFGWEVENV